MDRLSNLEIVRFALKRRFFQIVLVTTAIFISVSVTIHILRVRHSLEIPNIVVPLVSTSNSSEEIIERLADSLVRQYQSMMVDSLPAGQHWKYQVNTVLYPESSLRSDVLTMLLRCQSCGPPVVRVVRYDLDGDKGTPKVMSDETMFWGTFWHDYPQVRRKSGQEKEKAN
jgi:hypothetical protein